MNEQLAAMHQLALLRDGLVVKLMITTGAVLLSVHLLRFSGFSVRVLRVQLGLFLGAWIILLLVTGFAGFTQ